MLKQILSGIFFICTVTFLHAQTYLPDNHKAIDYEIPSSYKEGRDYLPQQIIFKIEEGKPLPQAPSSLLHSYLTSIGGVTEQMFPQAEANLKKVDEFGRKTATLTTIYQTTYSASIPVSEVMAAIKKIGGVEYVQPHIIVKHFSEDKISAVPNDPRYTDQWHLAKINAAQAWDISTGNPFIKVAILDGGTNLSHTDLGNIAYNYTDPIDGVDNDGDGWIDNYNGWNTGSNNNNVQYNSGGGSNHGVAACGTAAATVNNNIFGAGVSYGSPYMPVKIANASGQFTGGERGIFYAAQKGAKIINCSWGNNYPWPLIEDVTRYAAINKGCLIVAAAGNSNNSEPFWPASYEWVTCVAGSNESDQKAASSSFYKYVDISAPGENIMTTSDAGFANVGGGTSWAAPLVSGAAALAFSRFPTYTADQIKALLKETAYNMYSIPENVPYNKLLGRGRLDVSAALTQNVGPALHMTNRVWNNGDLNSFYPGATVQLHGNFINWLNPSHPDLTCIISTADTNISITDSIFQIGSIGTLAQISNEQTPFRFIISPTCSPNHIVEFTLTFSDGVSYTDRQFISIIVSKQYMDITHNNIHTSIGSNGRIGFMDATQQLGLGISKNGILQHLSLSSFMLATSATKVSDAGYGSSLIPLSQDFFPVTHATKLPTPLISDFDVEGCFNDNNAGINKIGIETSYKAWEWESTASSNFFIVEYTLKNQDTDTISNLYSSVYTRWQMPNAEYGLTDEIAEWDASRRLAYTHRTSPNGGFAGVKLLTQGNPNWYAINNTGASGSINIADGFSDTEKYTTMSSGLTRLSAGPGSVSGVLGSGPISLPAGDSVKVAFAFILGEDLAKLQEHADSAQARYDGLNVTWSGNISTEWHNPANWVPPHVPNGHGVNVTIPFTANQPEISLSNYSLGNLTLADNVHINITNGKTLTVHKNLVSGPNAGTSIIGGNVLLNGSYHQEITGKITIDTLVNDNVQGVTIALHGHLFIKKELLLKKGLLYSNRNLTLLSDTAGTAYINNFDNGFEGNLDGDINVQYHNQNSTEKYIGSPVALLAIDSLNGFTPNGTPGFLVPQPICQLESLEIGSPQGNWMRFTENGTVTNNCRLSLFEVITTGTMTSGNGYYMELAADSTYTFTGIANDGTFSIPLTSANYNITQGWNLISNPYPSPIKWEMANIPTGVAAIAKTWHTTGKYAGTFQDIDPSIPGQYIGISEGFWVRLNTPNDTSSFVIDNTFRTTPHTQTNILSNGNNALQIELEGNGFADASIVRFSPDASLLLDSLYDSPKMFGKPNQPYIYPIHQAEAFSTLDLGELLQTQTIPLGIKIAQNGIYTLLFGGAERFPKTSIILLEDHDLNTSTNLKNDSSYTFSSVAGVRDNRFTLTFHAPVKVLINPSTCGDRGSIHLEENTPYSWEYEIENAENSFSGVLNNQETIDGLLPDTYYVSLTEPQSGLSYTDTIVLAGVTPVEISVSATPNPSHTSQNITFFSNAAYADNYHWNFAGQDTSILPEPVYAFTDTGTYTVTLTAWNENCTTVDSIEIKVLSNIKIDEIDAENSVVIWQSGNEIHILTTNEWMGPTQILLYDMTGKLLESHQISDYQHQYTIELINKPAGIYNLSLIGKNQRINRKIVKGLH